MQPRNDQTDEAEGDEVEQDVADGGVVGLLREGLLLEFGH